MKESEHETETVESESKSSKMCQDIWWNILFVIYICMLTLKGEILWKSTYAKEK